MLSSVLSLHHPLIHPNYHHSYLYLIIPFHILTFNLVFMASLTHFSHSTPPLLLYTLFPLHFPLILFPINIIFALKLLLYPFYLLLHIILSLDSLVEYLVLRLYGFGQSGYAGHLGLMKLLDEGWKLGDVVLLKVAWLWQVFETHFCFLFK